MTENQLPAPVASKETLAQEFARLVGEYQDDDAGDATKEEAWNMIADFAVENAKAIVAALSHPGGAATEAMVEAAAREFLMHKGERPWRVLRGGYELWEANAPAMRAALIAALATAPEGMEKQP